MSAAGILPVPTILNILNDSNNNYVNDQNMDNPRAKKRRLDHLSWEEKIQRKKLKNRVAAQTSRDRKKAKQERMESAVQQLYNKNEILLAECEKLKAANQRLLEENAELNRRLQNVPCDSCKIAKIQSCPGVCASESGSTESLLRPKGTDAHTAAALEKQREKKKKDALLKLILACLLYRTSSTNWNRTPWTSTPWNNSLKVYLKISPEILRALQKRQLIKNRHVLEKKWWGRHQNNWNPMDLKC